MEIQSESLSKTIEVIKQAVLTESKNELYIPLNGKHTTNPEEEPFDLAEKIQSFSAFNNALLNDPKVMLLMGDTGSGKSVFSQQMYQQLWKVYKAGDPIPLWIPLPELDNPFESAVEEILTKYGFSELQISEIKAKEKFIFVVDGYDELHHFQNCYVTNKWDKWNTKVLITCRSQALYYQKDPDKYFMPFNGEKRLPMLLRRLYVAPFSKEQISAYIKKYQQLNSEYKICEEDFAKILGLTELITTPFLLHCAVETLPDILTNQVDNQKMTQAKLYDVFIEQWFTRQVAKLHDAGLLIDTEKNTKQQFWDYCKKLAQKMHEKEVSVIPYQGQQVGGRLFGKQKQSNTWENFFNEETEILRSACPLKRLGDHYYGFVHPSMIEYFATRAMYEEIQDDEFIAHNSVIESETRQSSEMVGLPGSLRVARDDGPGNNYQPSGGIHQRLISLERQSIQFLADRIEMSEAFQQKMLVILEASKKSDRYAIGAANAITALVRAGVTFNGADLCGIRIPGADISRGYFDSVDLSDADLSHTQMKNVWLREASLQCSQLVGINFGEYPRFMQDTVLVCFDFREDLNLLVKTKGIDIILSDTVRGESLKLLREHEDRVTSVHFSPDGKRLVSGSHDKTIRIWEVFSGTEIAVLRGHEKEVTCVAFSPDGNHVVSGSDDMTVRVWDITNKVAIAVLQSHEEAVKCVAYSPDGQQVVSGSDDETVRIWDINNNEVLTVLQGHEGEVLCVAYSPHGKYIASGSCDKTVRIWEVISGKPIAQLCDHNSIVRSIAFSPQGERVISGNSDTSVRIWDIETRKEIACLRGHTQDVHCVQFSADGKRAISGGGDNSVRVWDIPEELSIVRSEVDYRCYCLHLSPDARWVVLGNSDGTVRICDSENRKEHVVLRGHTDRIGCVQFSPDGQQVVSGGVDSTVRIWDVERRQEIWLLEGHTDAVLCVLYNPMGTCMASGSWDKTVRIWSTTTGDALAVLRGHQGYVESVAFSQDGKQILSGSWDETVRLWEVSTGELLTLLEGFEHSINQVAFCPNEEAVAVVGFDTITIVNIMKKQKICVLNTREIDKIQKIQFVGSERRVIVSGSGATVQIWDFTNRKCLHSQQFHAQIKDYSYHNNGSFVINFGDGSIECWQIMGEGEDYTWKFNWTTNTDCPNLFVEGLVITDVMGLSVQNLQLLTQCGVRLLNTKINFDDPHDKILYYDEVIRLDSNNVDAYRNRGNCKHTLDRYSDAIADFDESIRLNTDDASVYQFRGDCKNSLGLYSDAIADYYAVIRLNSDDSEAFRSRGLSKVHLGLYSEAIIDYNEATRLNPKDERVFRNNGMSNVYLHRYKEAMQDFEKAMEYSVSKTNSPLIWLIWSNIAFTFFLQDLLQGSLEILTGGNTNTDDIQDKSGSTYHFASNMSNLVHGLLQCALGNISEADILLRATSENTSNDASDRCELITILGMGFSHLKCYQKAFECWDMVIAENPNYGSALVQKENLMQSLAKLSLVEIRIKEAQSQELRGFHQRTAVQKLIKEDAISSGKTKWSAVKRTGSPIHHTDNNETEIDNNEDEEEKALSGVIAYEDNKLL